MSQPTRTQTGVRNFRFQALDASISAQHVGLFASDGGRPSAVLYGSRGRHANLAVLAAHPRSDYREFFFGPLLASAGVPAFCLASRYVNNDSDAQHEYILLDVAAGMRELRRRGFDDIILLGHSGGGSLLSLYQAEASREPDARITNTPGGGRVNLANEDMPAAVGQMLLGVHPGEGDFMGRTIDPAVVDEADPLLTDVSLDMYSSANGYRHFPEPSVYDRAWLARYRQAQLDRCARLDAKAIALNQRLSTSRHLGRSVGPTNPGEGQEFLERARLHQPYMVIYRTLANPAYLDPTIDPSDRILGSIFTHGHDPIKGNYGPGGLGRVLTPRAWLSTWSPAQSHARLSDSLAAYGVPTLFVYPTGDTEITPEHFQATVSACKAEDMTVHKVRADHNFYDIDSGAPGPRAEALDLVVEWCGPRFGLR